MPPWRRSLTVRRTPETLLLTESPICSDSRTLNCSLVAYGRYVLLAGSLLPYERIKQCSWFAGNRESSTSLADPVLFITPIRDCFGERAAVFPGRWRFWGGTFRLSPSILSPSIRGEARGEGSNSKDQHGDRSGRPALCDECAGYGDDYRLRLDGHSRSGPGYGQKLKTDGPASKGMGKSVCGLRPAFSAHVRLGEHRAPVQGSRVCLQLSFRGATHPLLSQTQGVDFSTQDPVGAGL